MCYTSTKLLSGMTQYVGCVCDISECAVEREKECVHAHRCIRRTRYQTGTKLAPPASSRVAHRLYIMMMSGIFKNDNE